MISPAHAAAHLGPDAASNRGRVPAWLMSFGLHTATLVTLALLVRPIVRGPAVEPTRSAGIALVDRTTSQDTYFSEEDVASLSAQTSEAISDATAAPDSMDQLPVELAVALPTSGELRGGAVAEIGMPGAAGFTTGERASRGLEGGQTQTQVFGATGTGTKFVYVFDRSASMLGYGGRPMAAARSQLAASLDDLESIHQFQIVFYNEEPAVFNPKHPLPPTILFATDENKQLAARFVRGIQPAGSTQHMDALRLALGLAPDVIFFLTDAAQPELTPGELHEIQRRNASNATIHTIEFGSGPFQGRSNFLVRLAHQNRGQHVYVDVTRLPR